MCSVNQTWKNEGAYVSSIHYGKSLSSTTTKSTTATSAKVFTDHISWKATKTYSSHSVVTSSTNQDTSVTNSVVTDDRITNAPPAAVPGSGCPVFVDTSTVSDLSSNQTDGRQFHGFMSNDQQVEVSFCDVNETSTNILVFFVENMTVR
jgi:hypothetical protein